MVSPMHRLCSLDLWINCHKVRLKRGKGGEGGRAGAARAMAAHKRVEQRKGKGMEEEEGAPTGGVPVSVTAGKKKRGKGTRATAGGR
jgi:hypothetical protein